MKALLMYKFVMFYQNFVFLQTPDAMVITPPTRELAMQIHKESETRDVRKFAYMTLCKAQLAYGGTAVQHQRNSMQTGLQHS